MIYSNPETQRMEYNYFKVRFQYNKEFTGRYWTKSLRLPLKGTRRAVKEWMKALSFEERRSRIVSINLGEVPGQYLREGYGNPKMYR